MAGPCRLALVLLMLAGGAASAQDLALDPATGFAQQFAQAAPGGLPATSFPTGTAVLQAPILTLNDEQLFDESAWGARAEAEIEAAAAALATENRRIEAQLLAEERSLTDRRPGMDPAAFRAEADAFDERVTGIRRAQDVKARAVSRLREAERRAFFSAAVPILSEVMRKHGAVAILDARAIFLADSQIDVTAEVVALADQRLGPGAAPELPDPVEEPEGEDAPTPTAD
ncbi:OmpH family outer membrane protein [Frigidibacter albus]|uniref:OmpH family outer membrane protein n=1 Tax=Frigidibacter albus TaxID=1465486 RepID=A0A6L8VE82_9RHOB|nr:OmpH family outer membrane protein [Frigidibacter albus]MZQ88051.1 OmpH family outer membrane protein [Frigidibacter albus]NBE30275.1 OmpH family outer membrane protein [Frigidibacter albus]